MDFVSPESISECIRITQEFRKVPAGHPSHEDKLEIKKMVLHAMDRTLKDIENLQCPRGEEDEMANAPGVKMDEDEMHEKNDVSELAKKSDAVLSDAALIYDDGQNLQVLATTAASQECEKVFRNKSFVDVDQQMPDTSLNLG